jgi:thiol-disulfide isomerase/thioredoxin
MLKIIHFLYLFLSCLVCVSQQTSFTIQGKISGLNKGDEVLLVNEFGNPHTTLLTADTIARFTANAENFTINGGFNVPYPKYGLMVSLRFVNKVKDSVVGVKAISHIFLDTTFITVTGRLPSKGMVVEAEVKGGETNRNIRQFIKLAEPFEKRYWQLMIQYDEAKAKLADSARKMLISYLGNHANSLDVPYHLLPYGAFDAYRMNIRDINKIYEYYSNLPPKIKNSYFGLKLFAYLNEKEKIKLQNQQLDSQEISVGGELPSYNLLDLNGDSTTIKDRISQAKYKLTLIDLWASWCYPCREENPKLVMLYNKYKDQGFGIVSISLDNNVKAWRNAILKDALPWVHLYDPGGFESYSYRLFKGSGIPYKILLDENKKIISLNTRFNDLEKIIVTHINSIPRKNEVHPSIFSTEIH